MDVNGTEPGAVEGQDDEAAAGCSWCERGSGAILIFGALGLLYIGFDLMSGGRLSQLFVSKVAAAGGQLEAVEEAGSDAAGA